MSKDNGFLYRDGEKVFCYHGKVIYEAKIVDTKYYVEPNKHPKTGSIGPHYHIHYAGWKSSWDEWVDESRLLKCNEANLEKYKQMSRSLKKLKPAMKRTINDSPTEKTRKRKREPTPKEKEVVVKKPKPKEIITVPEPLRAILFRDWQNIHTHQLLVPLPRKPTVTDIIEDYRKNRMVSKKIENSDDGIEQEVINGLHFYFNKCVGTRLLYKNERKQYRATRLNYEHLDNSQIFGAEHLLRLFVEFPLLMANTFLSLETINVLKVHLSEFLNFLNENRSKYFIKEYEEINI
ncbi:MRG-domain-containing protein [Rhizophagus irregularis]|uniref:Chromatin modification-related protein EAF3 n=1 Tax=Rhizophagus irregularis TaxID=588596 RepID=A0A2N0QAN8_9GLOM|nr:MRG-domain-containing protein [Rhizophagus irregularis]